MFEFITTNLPTILVGGLVAALLLGVAATMLRDRKRGKSSCGCHCAGCPSAGMCHPE